MLAAGWVTPCTVAAALIDPVSPTVINRSRAIRSGTGSTRGISTAYDLISESGVLSLPAQDDDGGITPVPPTAARSENRLLHLAPGLGTVAVLAAAATAAGAAVPALGAPLFAIIAGVAVALTGRVPARAEPGVGFTSKRILQASVVLLGAGLSFHQVVTVGGSSLPVLLGTLAVALILAPVLGRALGLGRDLRTLIGVGTAICGASAIAAADSVIEADESDVSYAVATIFLFNVIAVITFPFAGHALGLSQHSFGLWAGTAVNDLSSVVAASTTYGHAAASQAVIVKLTRTLAIIPVALALAALRRPAAGDGSGGRPGQPTVGPARRAAGLVPPFLLLFLLAAAADTAGLVPARVAHDLAHVATWLITAALAAIGLSTRPDRIRRAGIRPIALGALLWVAVAGSSLALQLLSGA